MRRAAKMSGKLKTLLGRVVRDIERKACKTRGCIADEPLRELLALAHRLLAQERQSPESQPSDRHSGRPNQRAAGRRRIQSAQTAALDCFFTRFDAAPASEGDTPPRNRPPNLNSQTGDHLKPSAQITEQEEKEGLSGTTR